MAENHLNTIIQLRYGTYSQWMNSDIILRQGEAAICAFPQSNVVDWLSNSQPDYTPPAIGIKIGDGHQYFYQLPWVQAIAADVYNWAKAPTKPSYSASEITGLDSYLEENFNISGDVNIAPRIYQIVEGTGDNANKYYLRYKESNEEAQWIVDTNHLIDLTPYAELRTWLNEYVLNNFNSLANFTATQTRNLISQLDYVDRSINNQFVTSVTETDGIIEVTRAQPSFDNISGIASISQGGTGTRSFLEDAVIVSNGSDSLTSIPIVDELNNTNSFAPVSVIKNYIDTATAGLTGAMHFIGDATVVINNNSSVDPRIDQYNFSNAQPGDVILYNQQEFVWTGSIWRLLGDEGSYAVKGSIKDIDIDPDAAIQQSKIANLSNTFDTKVDKVEGKQLSSNDFTDELKQKLEDINPDAQVNTIEHILLNGTEIAPLTVNSLPKAINLEIQEFTTAAQNKLTDIEAGAQVNVIEHIFMDGIEQTPDNNKAVQLVSNPDYANTIEAIKVNGVEQVPDNNKVVNITIDQAALNLNVLEGAQIPSTTGAMEEVEQVSKKLQLARVAVSGDVKDLKQTTDTYIVLNCGSSTEVI